MISKYYLTLTVILSVSLCGCYTVTPSGKLTTSPIESNNNNLHTQILRIMCELYCIKDMKYLFLLLIS